jgi:hypothetical protein
VAGMLPSRNFIDAGVNELHLFEYSFAPAWRGPALFASSCPSINAILRLEVALEAPVQILSVYVPAESARHPYVKL